CQQRAAAAKSDGSLSRTLITSLDSALLRLQQQWLQLQTNLMPLLHKLDQTALGAVVAESQTSNSGATTSQPLLTSQGVQQLCQLLADADGDAISLFSEQQLFWKQSFPALYPGLKAAVENFEFDQALAMIEQAQADQLNEEN
ncbi:MAG: hypothetical protein KKA56_01380, partial [Gammaproteobacteria bacterium]|nr:hypothetical protein [Gammaproteobacteria bacterium]